ncbi:MAG: hypothetical protein ACOH5I_11625 [Oligoflexus sp.]
MYLLRRLISLVIILAAITYAGFFAFLNSAPVYVILPFFGEVQSSAAVSYLVTFLVGSAFASLYFILDWTRMTFEIRRHRRNSVDLGYNKNGKLKKQQRSNRLDEDLYESEHDDSYKNGPDNTSEPLRTGP